MFTITTITEDDSRRKEESLPLFGQHTQYTDAPTSSSSLVALKACLQHPLRTAVVAFTMLRRAVSQRYGPLWLGIFAVVTFSLFVFVGHQVRDSADSGAAWNWKSVLPGSSSGGPSYQALVHVPDPQTEANYRIHGNYKWYSDSKLRELTACMARGDCPKNADKVSTKNNRLLGRVTLRRDAPSRAAPEPS